MVKLERIQLEKEGLTKFFSPVEVRILEVLWKQRRVTSSDIQRSCPDLSLACVAGTLDRLTRSAFVKRENSNDSGRVRFLYSPTSTRRETGMRISERVLESLVDTFGASVMDAFGKVRRRRR